MLHNLNLLCDQLAGNLNKKNNIKDQLDNLNNWKNIVDLIPENFKQNTQRKKTGLAGILAASLELAREGVISIMQKKNFDDILIKKTNE